MTPLPGTRDDSMLPRPGVVYIYDFAVSSDDVVIDPLGAEFISEAKKIAERAKAFYVRQGWL